VRLPLVVSSEFPIETAPAQPIAAAVTSGERQLSLAGLRVLIVDDELDARGLLTAMLERCGAEVLAAASAREGLETIERWRPDVLVADIGMPIEDGYGLIRKVRALPKERGGQTPALALTAYARTEDRVRAIAEGYQLHLAKPVDRLELATVVASLANRVAV
jgi:CheY-like chemotaxis protein